MAGGWWAADAAEDVGIGLGILVVYWGHLCYWSFHSFTCSYIRLALDACQLCVSTMSVAGNPETCRLWLFSSSSWWWWLSLESAENKCRWHAFFLPTALIRAIRDTEVESSILILCVFEKTKGSSLAIRMGIELLGIKWQLRWGFLFFVFCCCCFFRAVPSAHGGSQARGQIGALIWMYNLLNHFSLDVSLL